MRNETPPKKSGAAKAALAAFVLIWAGFVGAWLYFDQDPTELWIVNGLAIPVTVDVDGETLTLDPESYESIVTGRGTFEVMVNTDGRELARETIEIPKGRDIALYNVLGAA